MTNSGLKVNQSKTEFVIFHAHKSTKKSIKIGNTTINSKSTIKVLGVIFDENLSWDAHVNHAILKTKTAIYGLKRIVKYVTPDEAMMIANACVYSVLYYGSQIFLHPGLKKPVFARLKSTSVNIIKASFSLKHWNLVSFNDIHSLANTLTPLALSKYNQAIMLYDYKSFYPDSGITRDIEKNQIIESRLQKIRFTSSNRTKIGAQLIENSIRCLNDYLSIDCLRLSRSNFKIKMKKSIVSKN